MIPLRECNSLQLAILAAKAMGWEDVPPGNGVNVKGNPVFAVLPAGWLDEDDAPARVLWRGGRWDPAEDIGDAVRLAIHATLETHEPCSLRIYSTAEAAAAFGWDYADIRAWTECEFPRPSEASPDDLLRITSRALTERSLSALGVQGWEEHEEDGRG